jgi:hypothetical protein
MKTNVKDLTDYLLCVLRKQCSEIYIDDDEYLIYCTFKDKINICKMSILITRVDENVLAVEFMKKCGDIMKFY